MRKFNEKFLYPVKTAGFVVNREKQVKNSADTLGQHVWIYTKFIYTIFVKTGTMCGGTANNAKGQLGGWI